MTKKYKILSIIENIIDFMNRGAFITFLGGSVLLVANYFYSSRIIDLLIAGIVIIIMVDALITTLFLILGGVFVTFDKIMKIVRK